MLGVTEQRSHIEDSEFSGILGLAPESESSGPLLMSQLYEQGKISANAFSIQLAPQESNWRDPSLGSWLALGGLPDNVSAEKGDWISHRIAGSFHWQAKLNAIEYAGEKIRPSCPLVLTDTGTTVSYFVPEDFNRLIAKVCPDCQLNGIFYELQMCTWERIRKFESLWFQIDDYLYEMPVD